MACLRGAVVDGGRRSVEQHDHLVRRLRQLPGDVTPRGLVSPSGRVHPDAPAELAPATVANFVKLAEDGYYDGTTFHRVIPEFMVQGGDPNTKNRDPWDDGIGGPGYTIEDEFSEVSHVRGMVSMANKGKPRSGGSQFFILVKSTPDLDGAYALFGRVIEGMEVVDAIGNVPTGNVKGHGDVPLEPVVMEKVTVVE